MGKASDAQIAAGNGSSAAAFDRMKNKNKVAHSEALSQAKSEIAADNTESAWPRSKKKIASSSCWWS